MGSVTIAADAPLWGGAMADVLRDFLGAGRGQPGIALLIYGKNEQGDINPAQRKVVAAQAAEMTQGTE